MRSKTFYLSILHFFNDGFSAALLLFLPFIAKDLHLSLFQVGSLSSSLSVMAVVLALPSAFLAKKFGGFKMLILAVLIYGLGYLAIIGSAGYVSLLALFLLISIGFGLFHPIAFFLVSYLSEKENIGRKIGNFTAWGDVGRLVFSSFVTFFIVALTWRVTSLIYGIIILLFFCYIYFFNYQKKYMSEVVSQTEEHKTYRDLFAHPKFIFAVLSLALDNLASSPIFVFLPFLLISKHIQPAFLGSFAAALLVGNLFGKAVLGKVVDRFGGVKVFIITEILMAGLVVLMVLTNSPIVIIVVAVLLGIATRGTVPPTRAMLYEASSGSLDYERANGVAEFGSGIAAVSAPLILGLVSDRFGVESAFWVIACFALAATIPALIFSRMKTEAVVIH